MKRQKVLVWSNVFLWESQFSVLVEEALRQVRQGHEVVITSCRSALLACPANPKHRIYRCTACRIQQRHQRKILAAMGVRFERISLPGRTRFKSFVKRYTAGLFSKTSQVELLKENLDTIPAGAYALSEIRGDPRQTKLTRSELRDVKRVLDSAAQLRETAVRIQGKHAFTQFVCWNGRRMSDGYIAEVFETLGVPARSVITGTVSMNSVLRVSGSHVHGKYAERFNDYVKSHLHDEEEVDELAKNFVASYRSGAPIPGAPPTNRGRANKSENLRAVALTSNWAIELSHLPEAYAYEVSEMFERQLCCLNELAVDLPYEIVIRWHPNLAKANKPTRDWLGSLVRSLSSLRHILPEDPVDTYDLVDKSDLIINFGSTVGVYGEAEGHSVLHLTPISWYSNEIILTLDELSSHLKEFQQAVVNPANEQTRAERQRRAKLALAFLLEVEEDRIFTSLEAEHGPFFILDGDRWTSASPSWTRLRPSALKQRVSSKIG